MGKDMVPKRIFFTKGVGKHKERLTSFELALRDAGIAAQNLVRVSSIFPYLSEHHSFGETEDSAGDYAEELAAEMLATTLNVDFDPDRSWDEKKEIYRISNKIVRTANVTQSAVGDKRGLWTTVIASAVLIFD